MKNEDQQIKDLFSDKLADLEVPCGNNVWQGVQSQIGGGLGAAGSTGGLVWTTLSKILVGVLTVAAVGTGIFVWTGSSENPSPIEEKKELPISEESPANNEVVTDPTTESTEEHQPEFPITQTKEVDSNHFVNAVDDEKGEDDFGDYSMDRATEKERWEVVSPFVSPTEDLSENVQNEDPTPSAEEDIQAISADFSTMRYKENSMRFHFDAVISNSVSHEWYIDGFVSGTDSRLEYEFEDPGRYTVQLKVMGDDGMIMTQSAEVEAFYQPEVKVPNIFTPNGDAFNPYFDLEALSTNVTILQVQIYDMNKRLVFEQSENRRKWDGTDRFGNPCEPGNYLCVYQALGTDQKSYKGKKIVTLRR